MLSCDARISSFKVYIGLPNITRSRGQRAGTVQLKRTRRNQIGLCDFVVAGCDTMPVLELTEQALGDIAPKVFLTIIRDRYAAVALGWNERLTVRLDELLSDGNSVIALIG